MTDTPVGKLKHRCCAVAVCLQHVLKRDCQELQEEEVQEDVE